MMRIVLSTTPIRPVPTDYPPFGSMSLIQALRKSGYDPFFYDIDGLRPSFDEVVRFYQDRRPDLIAISAVVSTAYAYTKQLCLALKKRLPDTPIVVGGNLAASAELLHRFCGVDVCAVGEGEKVIVNLARLLEAEGALPKERLRPIPGITFLDEKGDMVFTGYESPLTVDEMPDPDYGILEQFSRIDNFLCNPLTRPDFSWDPRTYEPRRRGQKMATILSAKGCVARCTFCHRWDKGYRAFQVESIIRRMKHLKERYNVGFFCFGDENFGSNRKQVEELVSAVKSLDVLYSVQGVRVRSVDLDLLRRMKDSGCSGLYYGMETGSPRILQVMEKNASLEHNLQAARWTHEAGLHTVYQLVLGMPGENDETIRETTKFVKQVTEFLPEAPHHRLSMNYIQALPGTPTYEYARERGFIGKTPEEEEKYLLLVSDIDASDDSKFLNFTEEPIWTVKSWRHRILFEAERHWRRTHRWSPPRQLPPGGAVVQRDYYTQGGYFNLKKVVHSTFFYRYLWFLRPLYLAGYVVLKDFLRLPRGTFWKHAGEYTWSLVKKKAGLKDYRSLRRVMKETAPPPFTITEENMLPLRLGR
jgi:anaerobic magnesium-protoporphyrin IX monomethyl ester cyclase